MKYFELILILNENILRSMDGRVLNIPGFLIAQDSTYIRVLNMPVVFKMPGF